MRYAESVKHEHSDRLQGDSLAIGQLGAVAGPLGYALQTHDLLDLLKGSLLDFRLQHQVHETEAQALVGGLGPSQEHIQANGQETLIAEHALLIVTLVLGTQIRIHQIPRFVVVLICQAMQLDLLAHKRIQRSVTLHETIVAGEVGSYESEQGKVTEKSAHHVDVFEELKECLQQLRNLR